MPVALRRAVGVKMKLINALSGNGIVEPTITATWQAKLTEALIAEKFHARHTQIETA